MTSSNPLDYSLLFLNVHSRDKYLNLPWGWIHLNSSQTPPSRWCLAIPYKQGCSNVSKQKVPEIPEKDACTGHLNMGKNPESQLYQLHFFTAVKEMSYPLQHYCPKEVLKRCKTEKLGKFKFRKSHAAAWTTQQTTFLLRIWFHRKNVKNQKNKINSIKRIMKHYKSTIQTNTKSLRWHRTFSVRSKDHYFPS